MDEWIQETWSERLESALGLLESEGGRVAAQVFCDWFSEWMWTLNASLFFRFNFFVTIFDFQSCWIYFFNAFVPFLQLLYSCCTDTRRKLLKWVTKKARESLQPWIFADSLYTISAFFLHKYIYSTRYYLFRCRFYR